MGEPRFARTIEELSRETRRSVGKMRQAMGFDGMPIKDESALLWGPKGRKGRQKGSKNLSFGERLEQRKERLERRSQG